MRTRIYQSEADVALLQAFTSAAIAATAGCGYVHPGDISHRLFNGNRLFDPAEVLTIWEDGDGVAAWVLASPRHRGYDAQVRPDRRAGGFERAVLEYAETRTLELMHRHGVEADTLVADAFRCDTVRAGLLAESGWERVAGPPWVVNRAPLPDPQEPCVPRDSTKPVPAGRNHFG